MRYPDIYSRCIKMDGTIDLERLKRLSRDIQEDYERVCSGKTMLEMALSEIAMKIGTKDRKANTVRDGEWAKARARKVIDDVIKIEAAAFGEAAASDQTNNQSLRSIP